jgi:hypothetical protein
MGRQGNQDYGLTSRIENLPPAIAPGQPYVYGQNLNLESDPYAGGLYAESRYSNTTSTSQTGVGSTATGTLSTPTLAAGSQRSATKRSQVSSVATAAALCGIRPTHLLCWRGNAAGFGGFRLRFKFCLETIVVSNRGFVGLWDSTAAPTNVDPLTSATGNKIGVVIPADTGNLRVVTNTAGTVPTSIDLGVNFPVNNTDVWGLELKCLENANSIDWAVTKAGSPSLASGTVNSNLPSNTAFLGPQLWLSNNVTAAACAISQVSWTLSSKNGG